MGLMDNLQNATTEQKKAALAALAAGGQRGLEAYQAGLGNVNSAQQQAMDRVAGHGSYLGGNAVGELQSIVAQPGDAARQALQHQLSTFQADNQARQNSTGAYFDQVSAAIPLAKQYGDNEIGLAKQAAEAAQSQKAQQMAWEQQQHEAQMQNLAMQNELQRMRLLQAQAESEAGSDPFTDAQKAKLAQAMSDEQRVAEMQRQMDERVAAENERARVAALARQSEMAPDLADLDRMGGPNGERAQALLGRMNQARTVYEMAPLASLFDTQAPAPVASRPAQRGYDYSSGADVGVEGVRSPNGGTAMFPGSGLMDKIKGAAANGQYQLARVAAQPGLARAEQDLAGHGSAIQALFAQLQPYEQVQAARQAYTGVFGDDPVSQAKAMLSNPYPTEQEIAQNYLKQQQLQQQLNYMNQTGFTDPSSQAATLKAQEYLNQQGYLPSDVKLAEQYGVDPAEIGKARSSTAYQAASNVVEDMVQSFASGDAGSSPLTENDIKAAIVRLTADMAPAEAQQLIQVLPIVIADYKSKGLLTSDAYATNNEN